MSNDDHYALGDLQSMMVSCLTMNPQAALDEAIFASGMSSSTLGYRVVKAWMIMSTHVSRDLLEGKQSHKVTRRQLKQNKKELADAKKSSPGMKKRNHRPSQSRQSPQAAFWAFP